MLIVGYVFAIRSGRSRGDPYASNTVQPEFFDRQESVALAQVAQQFGKVFRRICAASSVTCMLRASEIVAHALKYARFRFD